MSIDDFEGIPEIYIKTVLLLKVLSGLGALVAMSYIDSRNATYIKPD